MSSQKKILISGAGIAGLAVARVLKAKGFEPEIIEASESLNVLGAGIYIPGNGVQALEHLGLGDQVRKKGSIITHRHLVSNKNKELMRLDLETVWHTKDPCLGILRKDLHNILLKGLDINIGYSTEISDIQRSEDKTTVTFDDGREEQYDLVVIAEGIYSKSRNMIFGDASIREVTPLSCRFVVDRPQSLSKSDWSLFVGPQEQFLFVPVNEDQAYVYVGRQPKNGETLTPETFLKPFESYPEPVASIAKGIDTSNAYFSPIEELSSLQNWGKGNVVVLGDAAHAMPPYSAQGASLSFEDAIILGELLAQTGDWHTMSEALTNARKQRVATTLENNRRREKLTNLPYWVAKIGLKLVGKKSWREDYAHLVKPAWKEFEEN